MKKLHLALSTNDIPATVKDYTARLGTAPAVVIGEEYVLWRTDSLNVSIRNDPTCKPGELRHLGWEDPDAVSFSHETDCNGVVWERFTAEQQAEEIENVWPGTNFQP
jgi:hypothetical protein